MKKEQKWYKAGRCRKMNWVLSKLRVCRSHQDILHGFVATAKLHGLRISNVYMF